MEIFDLFIQKVGKFTYNQDFSPFINKIYNIQKQTKNQFPKSPPEPLQKVGLQYQTTFNLFKEFPIFKPLQIYIEENISKFFNNTYLISDSWGNIYKKYGYVRIHHHGISDISGVLYLQTPKNSSLIIHDRHDPANSKGVIVNNGDILFFNGNQPHSTLPNLSDKDKVVIAFNLKINK